MIELDSLWLEIAGDVSPVPDNLKYELKDRWVRFHSLPNSKRYPETEEEMKSIVDRHNQILSSVFSQGENLIVVESRFTSEFEIQPASPSECKIFWCRVKIDPGDPLSICEFYSMSSDWSKSCLDWAITDTANDEISGLMVIGCRSKVIYHPYDGGMDVILSNTDERDALSCRFAQFLSPHPEGL